MENPTLESSGNGSAPSAQDASSGQSRQQRIIIIVSAIVSLVIAGALIGSAYYLLLETTDTAKWRDFFIIALAVEGFILGAGAVVMIIQLARLINLVQNEVQPVLESANETINTVRGTAAFLSDNLVQPVVKVSGYFAALRRMLAIINLGK